MNYEQAKGLKEALLKNSSFIKENHSMKQKGWDLQLVIVPQLTLDFLRFLEKVSISTTVNNKIDDVHSQTFSSNNEFILLAYHWGDDKLLYKTIDFSKYKG